MSSQSYDYIIVGAGSAGSVIANRLTADAKCQVLLLEAGRPDHPWTRVPVGFARLIDNPKANWLYRSEPDEGSGQRPIPVPRGKLLGGSSAINGMVFVRGQSQDYDTWAQLGNRGWSYRDVLPYFRRMETYSGGEDEYRGREGPLQVTDLRESGPLYDSLISAANEMGIPYNADYNGAVQEGISMTQASIRKGRRMSTARCYLDPVKSRPNLTIMTGAHTDNLIIEDKLCRGVRFTKDGVQNEARAKGEVIVSAGSVNSPQILELSGIGQPGLLKRHGIEIRHVLPGVGENLRDHYAPRMKYEITASGQTYNDKMRGIGTVFQALRYAMTGTGLLGLPAAPLRAYVCSRDGLDSPDINISVVPFLIAEGFKLAKGSGITVITHPLRSESTGSIHIGSGDSKSPPKIHFNFLTAEYDRQVTLAGMKIVRGIMDATPMASIRGTEIAPGPALQKDDELLNWVRETAETTYHPIGTCKMGTDDSAVVDDQLRVRGMQGLRVADASIMPTLTSGNTNAPSIMIGEKAADMLQKIAA